MTQTGLTAAAVELMAWLGRFGWPACIIGGLAVQRWGEPRLTQDVDVTVLVEPGHQRRFADQVLDTFAGRRPDAREFALTHGVLLVRSDGGVALDLALGTSQFEAQVIARASSWDIEPGMSVATCSAEDLIIYKLIARRPRDLGDIESVVARQWGVLDEPYLHASLSAFAELLPDVDLVGTLRGIVRQVGSASARSRER